MCWKGFANTGKKVYRNTEMAVLYRTNVDARAMSELMTEYQIPFVMKEHLNNIYEHFIALDMISYLRLSQENMTENIFSRLRTGQTAILQERV